MNSALTLEHAQRLTEVLLGLALIQHSLEHCTRNASGRLLFAGRIVLAVLLVSGAAPRFSVTALVVVGLLVLKRYQGPYNGGSDRMSYLILLCLCVSRWVPTLRWQEMAMGYLAVQLVLSYAVSGWVKVVNRDWRSGASLVDVFRFSAYPVSESLRAWSYRPQLLKVMAWSVMLFEVLFPLALFDALALQVALFVAACFHLANAFLFGLNRFVWSWIAAYPSILWLQQRLLGF
jgi:uncharacterized membrane protein YphA (DoxX/SURF4 family)